MAFDVAIIGYIGGLCTTVSQFPQAYKVIKTKDTKSISPGMYFLLNLGILSWFLYGVLLGDLPMILGNGIGLIPSLYILYITICNNRIKK